MDFEQATMWRRLQGDPGNYYCQAAEPERAEFRRFVEGLLHQGTITVEFFKADGTTRVMICTLSESHGAKYMTAESYAKSPKQRKTPTTAVRTVWDCEASAWRSFRWDRLKKLEFTIA